MPVHFLFSQNCNLDKLPYACGKNSFTSEFYCAIIWKDDPQRPFVPAVKWLVIDPVGNDWCLACDQIPVNGDDVTVDRGQPQMSRPSLIVTQQIIQYRP